MTPTFFDYGSGKLAWYKTGTGKPLLILHGWGSSSAVMMPLAEKLGKHRTCYLIDFPGFGSSPEPPQAWSVDDYADVTKAFAGEVIEEKPFDLLVHSYGARVALKLLTDESAESIDKVIFTGAAGLRPKRKPSYYFRKYTAKALKLPFLLLPGQAREKGLNRLRGTALWKKLGSSDYQQLSGVMRETFVKSVTEYLDPLLPQINHEVLLIWGRDDAATPLDQGERMDAGLKKSALVVMDGAGHYAFLDNPAHFTAIAESYLTSAN
jgi:pimeloyl-ACP methyl ester carboxylesterase